MRTYDKLLLACNLGLVIGLIVRLAIPSEVILDRAFDLETFLNRPEPEMEINHNNYLR